MSREKNQNRRWGMALRKLRKDAHLSQTQLAKLMGYPSGKGKISEIESGSLPIREENVRLWVHVCKKTMFDFYATATQYEAGVDLIQPFVFPKKSK
jgi:transcriptional regulator with XRE-family HTH domain